jgi:hypothetical protein
MNVPLARIRNSASLSSEDGGGWDSVPVDNGSLLRGSIVKFNAGAYFADRNPLAADAEFFVVGVLRLWIRWDGRDPVEFITAEPGRKLPGRETLSHLEKETWPPGMDGKPADPWCETYYVYIINTRTAADATFTTHSIGGRRAVRGLAGAIRNMRRSHPGAVPIVGLDCAMMPTDWGPKPRPSFKIIDWKLPAAPPAAAPAAVSPPIHEETVAPAREDMNDEIPF